MAKRLEEHLHRSAQTKEEYLDPSTLKKRLQMITHGLEVHRGGINKKDSSFSTSAKSGFSSGGGNNSGGGMSNSKIMASQQKLQQLMQQFQQLQQLQKLQQQQ